MPVHKRQKPFLWDEDKKKFIIECLARVRNAGGKRDVIAKTLLKEFVKAYPECKLAANSLYKYAINATSSKQLPGETESRVTFWTFEKEQFLIECETRARDETLLYQQQGMYAGKRGRPNDYRKLVVKYFTAKYNEHTSDAIYNRILHLRKEKRIATSCKDDNSKLYKIPVANQPIGGAGIPFVANLPIGGANGLTSVAKIPIGGADTLSVVNLPIDGADRLPSVANLRICDADTSSVANLSISDADDTSSIIANVDDTVMVDDNIRVIDKANYDLDTTLFFQRTMKCWENGFNFSKLPLFIGACANCSAIIPNDVRVKTMAATQQPNIFNHYEHKDIKLNVVNPTTKKLYICTLCVSTKDLLTKYRLAPEQIKSFPLPQVILDVSDYDKRHISLVALKSNTAKASNQALRIFRHLKGDYIVQHKGETCYFDMYAMIVNQDPANSTSTTTTSTTQVVAALRWLRQNNHLYKKFAANYETLIRFIKRQPGQPITVPIIDDMDFDPVSDKQTKTSVLDGEPAALMVPAYNVSSRGVHVGNIVTATQNLRNLNAAQMSHDNLVNVYIRDPYLEAKVFPWLFPYGIGGWSTVNGFCVTRGTYMQWRIRMCDGRFRDEADYMFYMLDIIIKERLQYYASVKINVARLAKPLTVDMIKTSGPYNQYGTEVPATIPNSRNYWIVKTLDLLAMSEYMDRVPDFFVTLTENDSWPELQAVIRDGIAGVYQAPVSKEFENAHKRGKPAMKYSVQTVIAFYRRFELFRVKFLQDPKGPFGKVLDYWMRIEYQKRGSLHVHLVVWCDKETIPKDVVSAEMPRFDHPMNEKWRQLVGNYQKHTCFQQRCFTGKRGKLLFRCKYGYPYKVNNICELDKSGMRFNYIRRYHEDSSIVTYNLPLLLLWDGHVNIQQVTNGGWELYLAKYVAKSEYPINMRFKRKTTDCEMYLRTRVVSLLEAAALILQRPHVFSSRDIIYLPIDVSPANRFLKRVSDMPAQTTAVMNNDELYYDTKLIKYLDRPKVLSHLTYPQFYARYRYVGQAANENEDILDSDNDCKDDDDDDVVDKTTLRDCKGRLIRKRLRHEAIVRFKEYSPYGDDLERYCLTKLLQNVPVDRMNIDALKDTTGSYLEECLRRKLIQEEDEAMQFLEGAAKRGTTLKKLRDIASRLINGNWLQDQDIDQLLETVAPYQIQAERVRAEMIDDNDDNVIVGDRDGLDLHIRKYLPIEKYIAGFTTSQRAAFDYVTKKLLKGEQCLVFITGGGGVGKSYLLDSFVVFCQMQNKTVQKLATTGCAAHLIGGLTIHTFLRMSVDLVSHIERGSTDAFLIEHLEVLLIDEVSMLDERVMQKLEECLIRHSNPNESVKQRFAGKSIIMFGDPAQLPPIGKHIWQPTLLKGFQYVVLKEIVRQKDDREFIDLLNRVRLGEPIKDDIELLKTRVITQADLKQIDICGQGLMLFPTRRQKDEMNALELAKVQVNERVYLAQDVDRNDLPVTKSVREYIANIEQSMQLFPAVLKLKIGARVMLLRNRDVEHGWVNGTLATVVSMSDDYVVLLAINNPQKRLVTYRMKQEICSKITNQQYYRKQFPLDLAYGVTIHKSQGQTLDVVAVSASGLSFSGQFYTAISRVRELTGLYLINFDPQSIFLAPDIRRFIRWMDEVDILRQQPSNWNRPCMPVVSQLMSFTKGYITKLIATPPAIQDVNNTLSKRKYPVQTTIEPQATVVHDVSKRSRTQQQLDVQQLLVRIHRINPNVSLRDYWRAFDVILNEDEVLQFTDQWDCRLTDQDLRYVYNDKSPHCRVDQQRSHETYTAIAKDYGRVIQTSADGSCMFHALSLCLFGNENYSNILRLISILGFRQYNNVFETVHAQNHMDYTNVQTLIHRTSNMHGGMETWGGAAHLKSLACMTCREIYVYTSFTKDCYGCIHPRCLINRNLSVDELQRKCNDGSLYGAYFTRYEPIHYLSGQPLTVLLSDAGAGAHYSAVLPVADDAIMVQPHVVIPPPEPLNDDDDNN